MSHATSPPRWGIVGTGGIAAQFATDMKLLPGARIVAVGSRTHDSAEAFGTRFNIANRHSSYEALVRDPYVDAVYIATPHPGHHDAAMLAIAAGKAVLVEKPFTLNAPEARELISAARDRGSFLMEAMWTRFLPHVVRVRDLIGANRLGDVRSVFADFGEYFLEDAAHRSYAPELGGGALLDLGVYPVSFASMVLGAPEEVTARSQPAFTGVDSQTAIILTYSRGRQALLFATLETRTANRASIHGRAARIEIDDDFFAPAPFRLIEPGRDVEIHTIEHKGRGLRHQAAEVSRCLQAGLTESPVMPLSESLSIMETLDEVRRQIGLRYPGEVESVNTTAATGARAGVAR